jgi:hypothetical protein
MLSILKVHHRDVLARHLDVLDQDRQGALRDRTVTDEQNLLVELDHGVSCLTRWGVNLSKSFAQDKR